MADKNKKPKAQRKPKASGNTQKLMEQIEKLSVMELAELIKALEDKFGVVAVAPATAVPAAGAQQEESKEEDAIEGQTTFNVVLTSPGESKISVIKMVREINQTLGLKEAKDLVESTPKEVVTGVNKADAEEAKKKLEDAGATVELK